MIITNQQLNSKRSDILRGQAINNCHKNIGKFDYTTAVENFIAYLNFYEITSDIDRIKLYLEKVDSQAMIL